LQAAETLSTELEKVSITIPVQVGEEDKIFGTVTSQMIADNLKEKGYEIDKRKIEIDEAIKTLGIYSVNVKLHPSVSAKVKVWVVRE
jgi:large subunit ribosomal protein L9